MIATNTTPPIPAEIIESLINRRTGLAIRSLNVRIDDKASVTITGHCETYYVSQLAESVAAELLDATFILTNDIEVI